MRAMTLARLMLARLIWRVALGPMPLAARVKSEDCWIFSGLHPLKSRFETDLGLIFMIEFFSHGSKLPTFELSDLDGAPSFGGSDESTEHQFQDGPFAELIKQTVPNN